MSADRQHDGSRVDRRTLLAGLSTAATMGLAGCGGGGNGDQDGEGPGGGQDGEGGGTQTGEGPELGERVPQLNIDYFTDLGQIYETYAEISIQNLSDRLGLNVDATPRDTTSLVFDLYGDKRTSLLPLYTFSLEPDPHFTTRRLAANQAGTGLGPAAGQNTAQWPNCDYSVRAYDQATKVDTEERQNMINEAWSIASYELPMITTSTQATAQAYRTDVLDVDDDIRFPGHSPHLWQDYLKIHPKDGNTTIVDEGAGAPFEILNPFLYRAVSHWSNSILNSNLLRLDRQDDGSMEIVNSLASAIEYEDDNSTVIVEVRDDANFHNGDPVTAEDVKFTYDYAVAGSNAGQHTFAPSLPILNEITTVDEKTAQFDMSEPYAPLTDREFITWAILHKDSWMDQLAEHGVDTFDSFETDFDAFGEIAVPPEDTVGCGPWQLESFEQSQSVTFTAWDDHPIFQPEMDITMINIQDDASRFAAIKSGRINTGGLTPQQAQQVEGDKNQNIKVTYTPGIQNYSFFNPNCAAAPTKFIEFRRAIAAALNRQEMVAVSQLGKIPPEMHSVLYTPQHPWRPPNDMLYKQAPEPSGSEAIARAFLTEAGWGWDDDGNLRYPADADLEPLWPKESAPNPDNYPCLTEDGYVRPEGYEMTEDQVPGYNMSPEDVWPDV